MRKIISTVMAGILIAGTSSTSIAGRHGSQYDAPRHYSHHAQHGHRKGNDWVAPLVVLGITAAAIGAMARQPPALPPAYSVTPPVFPNLWYYCASAGQYHPYVQYCPEGWQRVVPNRH